MSRTVTGNCVAGNFAAANFLADTFLDRKFRCVKVSPGGIFVAWKFHLAETSRRRIFARGMLRSQIFGHLKFFP